MGNGEKNTIQDLFLEFCKNPQCVTEATSKPSCNSSVSLSANEETSQKFLSEVKPEDEKKIIEKILSARKSKVKSPVNEISN